MIRKAILTGILGLLLFGSTVAVTQAQGGVGIIPRSPTSCDREETLEGGGTRRVIFDPALKQAFESKEKFEELFASDPNYVLGCAVKLGRIRFYMVPYYITYLIQFILEIVGIICVLFVVIGGYKYIVGGLTEDKESGKKILTNALIGLVVSLSAWIIVNFVQVALTS